jgi:hypothetical protein
MHFFIFYCGKQKKYAFFAVISFFCQGLLKHISVILLESLTIMVK